MGCVPITPSPAGAPTLAEVDAPAAAFQTVSGGSYYSCGLRAELAGELIEMWPRSRKRAVANGSLTLIAGVAAAWLAISLA